MKRLNLHIKFLLFIVFWQTNSYAQAVKPYAQKWDSVSSHHESPEWFKDSKFGIYFHWGVYSVPSFGSEWYPRMMNLSYTEEYKHHVKTYGDPSKFGYDKFIPMFKAEKFDADEWVKLFKDAGAKFAGPVAEHHDGFSMWSSKTNPWNAKDMGPRKDIVGEMAVALKKQNMKLITTFHHARQLQRYKDSLINNPLDPKINRRTHNDSHYPFINGYATSSNDALLKILYGNIPEDLWLEKYWFTKLKEVIDQYSPDIIWFDSWLDRIPEAYRLKFVTYYLNEAKKNHQEVVIVRKQNDLPLEVSVDDLEKSRKNKLDPTTWMTDETLSTGSWSYTEQMGLKTTADVLHILIDVVSKNGVLLLNVSPKADGSIPNNQREILLAMGKWLKTHGEAIYGTRPWYVFGEGTVKEPEGNFKNHTLFSKIKYSEKDIRYTTKVNHIYATFLGSPQPGTSLLLNSFAADSLPKKINVRELSIIGSDEKIDWSMEKEGLRIKVPYTGLNEFANTIKIKIQGIDRGD